MSFSYAVGGKSVTHQRGRKQGDSVVTKSANRGKKSGSSSGSGGIQRSVNRSSTGNHPVHAGGTGATPHTCRAAAGTTTGRDHHTPKKNAPQTNDKTDPKLEGSSRGNIVTLSDLKTADRVNQKRQGLQTCERTKPAKSNAKSLNAVSGRKLGAAVSRPSDAKLPNVRSSRTVKSLGSEYHIDHKRNGTNINCTKQSRTSNISSTITSTRTNIEGISSHTMRKSQGKDRGMAYNNRGLYASSSQPVGQRSRENDLAQSPEESPTSPPGAGNQQQQAAEGTAQYNPSGGYTMISPNNSKRQQLTNKANQELKAYEEFKSSKRPAVIQGAPQSTGGQKSEEEARRVFEREHRNKKYEQIMKREQWQKEKRDREDKEIEEKKARARAVAEQNKQRAAERERRFLKDDHAKTNEHFLRRFETNQSSSSNSGPQSENSNLQYLMEMFPGKDPAKLQKLLDRSDGDVSQVIDLLT